MSDKFKKHCKEKGFISLCFLIQNVASLSLLILRAFGMQVFLLFLGMDCFPHEYKPYVNIIFMEFDYFNLITLPGTICSLPLSFKGIKPTVHNGKVKRIIDIMGKVKQAAVGE